MENQENKTAIVVNLTPDAQIVNVAFDRIGTLVTHALEIRRDGVIKEVQETNAHELEIAKINKEVQLKQLETNTQKATTIAKWDYLYRFGVLVLCFGLIILVYQIGGTALTSTLLPVITFILGNALKDKIIDLFKVSPQEKRDDGRQDESE